MTKFQERFNAKMKEWYDSDKSSTKLFTTEYERMLAYLWACSEARKSEENIAEIKEFGKTNIKLTNLSMVLRRAFPRQNKMTKM